MHRSKLQTKQITTLADMQLTVQTVDVTIQTGYILLTRSRGNKRQ
jgi:hypothetical protein